MEKKKERDTSNLGREIPYSFSLLQQIPTQILDPNIAQAMFSILYRTGQYILYRQQNGTRSMVFRTG